MTKIIKKGWKLDAQGNPEYADLAFNEPNRQQPYGYGSPISVVLAKKMIKDYWNKSENQDAKPYGFTFGKESLLSILSQENCEGIRFYLAKKDFITYPADWTNGQTLVAIGIKKGDKGYGNDPEIGAMGDYLVDNLENDIDATKDDVNQEGIIIEIIPPFPKK